MKRLIIVIGLILGAFMFGFSREKQQEEVYSAWSFQCRETGEYFYEDQGILKVGKTPDDDRYLWICEATATENVSIRNKKSGNYLQLDKKGQLVCAARSDIKEENQLWSFEGFGIRQMTNCSWYTISNLKVGKEKFLAQGHEGIVLDQLNRNTDWASHWTLVREKGSVLPFALYPDSVVEASFLGQRVAKALRPTEINSDYHGVGGAWKLKKDISAFPQLSAENNTLIVALYNMALEEMQLNLRDDSTFMTGALWPDTWTRDVVYSIYFAFSWIHPDIAKRTLRKQTLKNPKEALQDTGTGGSWPISTDRVVWALAAWEYYLSTGDKDWLDEAYESLSYTAKKDIHVAFDENIGLFKGETCSMDWRTHTYPNWFSNENIGESFSSGTNALHLFMYYFLKRSGEILAKDKNEIKLWEDYHGKIRKGLNTYFWNEEKGLYASYLYPEFMNYRPSARVDIMSNGLCATLGAATPEQVESIVANYPLYPYGGAVLYPTIPDDFAYHNKSIWAVWQTPYLFAAKKEGNLDAVSHIMKSQIRQGALFLTHKENMTYDTGYDRNTALNSDRQLWSVASYISMVYRTIFGLDMRETGLSFSPVLPEELIKGTVNLKGFHYRNAILDIAVKGTGNEVRSIKVNGQEQHLPYELPASSSGKFNIEIEMSTIHKQSDTFNLVEAGPERCWSPVEPVLKEANSQLTWTELPGLTYRVYGPGINEDATSPYSLRNKPNGFYTVYAIAKNGFESDCSNPILHTTFKAKYEAEDIETSDLMDSIATGFSGKGYIKDFSDNLTEVVFDVDLPESGNYAFSLTGSNGKGPHDVYCFIRSVFIDEQDSGTFILESSGDWNKWTTSNHLIAKNITKGKHRIKLRLNPQNKGYNNNMSYGKSYENSAYIDYLSVIKL